MLIAPAALLTWAAAASSGHSSGDAADRGAFVTACTSTSARPAPVITAQART
jgi:hypothetical protein